LRQASAGFFFRFTARFSFPGKPFFFFAFARAGGSALFVFSCLAFCSSARLNFRFFTVFIFSRACIDQRPSAGFPFIVSEFAEHDA
jgi:hypothetical protein